MKDKMVSPDYLRSDLRESLQRKNLDPDDLSVFQRILLTTDGMVTEMLEAYLGEKMVVTKLAQQATRAEVPAELESGEADTVVIRSILLQGAQSGKTGLFARSAIVINRLPQDIQLGLQQGNTPIGQLLLDSRLESYREILSCDIEPAADLAEYFGIDPGDDMLTRTYLVCASHRPIMLITEKFPRASFPD